METLEAPTPDELEVALRDCRPRIDPEFAAKLDEMTAAGFPRTEGRRFRLPRRLPRLPRAKLLPALAATASLLIVAAVVTSLGDDTGGGPGERSAIQRDRGAGTAETAASPALGESAPPDQATSLAPAAPAETSAAKRRVERSASLTLGAPADEVETVADDVVRITDRYRGFVLSSNVSSGEARAQATFDLRIPTTRLRDALRDLSALADLKARSQSGQDITPQFVSAQDRLSDGRAQRRALLRRLEKAGSAAEAAAIRQQLRLVRSEIAAARGELRSLRERTNYTRVSVAVEGDETGSGGGHWTPGDALDDAIRILAAALSITLVALAILLPFAVIGLAGMLAGRKLTHRRREQALET